MNAPHPTPTQVLFVLYFMNETSHECTPTNRSSP